MRILSAGTCVPLERTREATASSAAARAPRAADVVAPRAAARPAPVVTESSPRFICVGDAELSPALSALMEYHRRVGFFDDRFDGMQRVRGLGPDRDFEVQLTPNRRAPSAKLPSACSCALCSPDDERERGLRWRGWVVWPNAFPYVPFASQHVVISKAEHVRQSFSAQILADMLDYQRLASAEAPVTLHYNGNAGNSQFHLHWQAQRETLPLERHLDAGRLPLGEVLKTPQGSVSGYAQGFYAGILCAGEPAFVVRAASVIIAELERDPRTQGLYNLILLKPKAGRARLVIVPRRSDALVPSLAHGGKIGFGALPLGGVIVMSKSAVPEHFGEDVPAAARATVVPPCELEWLTAEKLGKAAGPAAMALRAR